MLLKRLQLQGYKTFANKTDFLFDAGITAVVGPNGSGKSNIADAIRWVLGEQSYAELRGRRSLDMIFAGSQQRARAGMASAVLTLDNAQGWLPIDFSEVEIGRRTYRTGENEYLLNGKRVRLRDMRDLLAGSALAQRTYTMIGQGLIDSALSLRSDERRALFEEAAGISHYKERRAETLRRLQETQHNLERVRDLLAEIEPRLRTLRQQAARAQNYEQVAADLRHLLRLWYGYQWESGRAELRAQRHHNNAAEAAWRESRRQLAFVQEQLDDLRARLRRYQNAIQEKETARETLREQLEQARRQVAILTERQAAAARQLREVEVELPDLEAQQQQAQLELETATAELAAAQAALAAGQAEVARFEATFQTQQAEWESRRTAVRDLDRRWREAQRLALQEAGQLAELRERLAERQRAGFDRNAPVALRAQAATVRAELDKVAAEMEQTAERRRQAQRERQESLRRFNGLRQEQSDLNRRVNSATEAVARLEERVRVLEQLRQKAGRVRGQIPLLGRLAQFLTIPEAHQTALEAAVGGRLGTLIVADREALVALLDANRETPLAVLAQTAVWPPVWPTPPADLPGLLGRARDLVQCEAALVPAADLLLGPVWLFADEATALAAAEQLPPGCLAVAPTGLICHAGGLAERRPVNARDGLLAQEQERRVAQAAVAEQQQALRDVQREQAAARKAADDQQAALDELAAEERKIGRAEQLLAQQHNQLQRDLDRIEQQLGFLEQQERSHAAELVRLEERIAALEASQHAQQAELVRSEAAWQTARVALEELPTPTADRQRAQFRQQVQADAAIAAGRRAAADSRRATLGQIESRLARQLRLRETLQQQLEAADLPAAEAYWRTLQERLESVDTELRPLRAVRDKLHGETAELEGELALRQKTAHTSETAYTETRLALNRREAQMDHLRERIHADLGLAALSYDEDETVQTPLPIGDVVEQLPHVETLPDDIADAVQRRRAQLQRMGAINPDAPAEYKAAQERFDFLTAQIADLNATEARLRQVIGELDGLTSREFATAVQRVNGVFGDLFARLFGGGSAELTLTDPDDLTVSGVEIVAQLPRRRAQGLELLSGGERALTAAALIFALLSVAPPPFCVMDEVDAALDEANITRFRDVLGELSAQTQFIIITHNRGTVQAANTLYGVSMTRDGTSQVISLKPDDYVRSEDVGAAPEGQIAQP